jgi:hypothetical protein
MGAAQLYIVAFASPFHHFSVVKYQAGNLI